MHVPGGMSLANVLRQFEWSGVPETNGLRSVRPKECICVRVSSQMHLHRFKCRTADVAELAQGILVLARTRLNLFASKVGLRIRTNDVLNHLLSGRQHVK